MEPFFVLLKKPNGKEILVNLNLCFAIDEGDKGEAIAVSIAGAAVPTGETFLFVKAEMLGKI